VSVLPWKDNNSVSLVLLFLQHLKLTPIMLCLMQRSKLVHFVKLFKQPCNFTKTPVTWN